MPETKWSMEDVRSEYTIVKELGAGQFGTTFLVVHRPTGDKFACKSINKHAKCFSRRDVEREVQILASLSGQANVVELCEVWEDSHSIHIVQELCEGGELFDVIVDRGHLSERDAAVVARTLLEVIRSCHDSSILHRDLKPENWLLKTRLADGEELHSEQLRAIDFGLSVFLAPGQRLKTLAGSSYYMAPEVLKGDYGLEADLWSAGVIIYILLSGLPPFWGSTEKQIFRRILHEQLDLDSSPWPDVSDKAKDIVRRLLTRDIESRMTLEEALNHPWIAEYRSLPTRPLSSAVFNRLKRFTGLGKLKGLLLNVVAHHLPEDSISQLREMFHTLDVSKGGTIKVEELRAAVQQLGMSVEPEAIQAIIDRVDVDGSGEVEYEEFLAAAINKKQLVTDQSLSYIFAELDRNHDGVITLEEFFDVVSECNVDITKEQLANMLQQEAGINEVTPEAFRRLMYDLARDDLIPGRLEKFLATAKQITCNNAFKQLALMVMASTIPNEEVEELHELFASIDEEGDGFITFDQLRQTLDIVGCEMAKEEVDALLKGLDVTGNGRISYSEFLAGCIEKQDLVTELKIREAFSFFDSDGSGSISMEELEEALVQLDMDPMDAQRMMDLADSDGNNDISFEEFRTLMLTQHAPCLVNRMASVATMSPGCLPPSLSRASVGMLGLSRSSMGAGGPSPSALGATSMDYSMLMRKSMATPSLARASMGGGPMPGTTAVVERMVQVENEWRKGSFTGLHRPSMTPLERASMNGLERASMNGPANGLARMSMDRSQACARSGLTTNMSTVKE